MDASSNVDQAVAEIAAEAKALDARHAAAVSQVKVLLRTVLLESPDEIEAAVRSGAGALEEVTLLAEAARVSMEQADAEFREASEGLGGAQPSSAARGLLRKAIDSTHISSYVACAHVCGYFQLCHPFGLFLSTASFPTPPSRRRN